MSLQPEGRSSVWQKYYDARSKRNYYYNTQTKQSTWQVPDDYQEQQSSLKVESVSRVRRVDTFVGMQDEIDKLNAEVRKLQEEIDDLNMNADRYADRTQEIRQNNLSLSHERDALLVRYEKGAAVFKDMKTGVNTDSGRKEATLDALQNKLKQLNFHSQQLEKKIREELQQIDKRKSTIKDKSTDVSAMHNLLASEVGDALYRSSIYNRELECATKEAKAKNGQYRGEISAIKQLIASNEAKILEYKDLIDDDIVNHVKTFKEPILAELESMRNLLELSERMTISKYTLEDKWTTQLELRKELHVVKRAIANSQVKLQVNLARLNDASDGKKPEDMKYLTGEIRRLRTAVAPLEEKSYELKRRINEANSEITAQFHTLVRTLKADLISLLHEADIPAVSSDVVTKMRRSVTLSASAFGNALQGGEQEAPLPETKLKNVSDIKLPVQAIAPLSVAELDDPGSLPPPPSLLGAEYGLSDMPIVGLEDLPDLSGPLPDLPTQSRLPTLNRNRESEKSDVEILSLLDSALHL